VIAESKIFSRANLALLARSTTGLKFREKYSFLTLHPVQLLV
jgi:hypothetical protein